MGKATERGARPGGMSTAAELLPDIDARSASAFESARWNARNRSKACVQLVSLSFV